MATVYYVLLILLELINFAFMKLVPLDSIILLGHTMPYCSRLF